MHRTTHHRVAFSLVELSIVLVILGLLVGGVLSGQTLIRAAELRSITTDYGKFITAFGGFRDKYFAIPGDMTNATKFWGAVSAPASTCALDIVGSHAVTGTNTCDGDGDGLVNSIAEDLTAWQQLSNAQLLEGGYNPTLSATGVAAIGKNVPRSRITNAGWSISGFGTVATPDYRYAANYGNALLFGGIGVAADRMAADPVIKAEEAWNIDTKMDDGKPATGKVLAWPNASYPKCANATDDAYALDQTDIGCPLIFISGY